MYLHRKITIIHKYDYIIREEPFGIRVYKKKLEAVNKILQPKKILFIQRL